MRAVLAACCLFAVYLLFRSGDAKATGDAAPPLPPGAAAPPPPPGAAAPGSGGPCDDTDDMCGEWISFCGNALHEYVQINCNGTCDVCQTGAGDEPPPFE
uniref:ShKL8 n=1 Tax=Colubraria reticulata TaxID=604273 RepID=A0A481SMI0_9CAEN|nr:ShKL8 [Colubraria reticulata]